MATNGMSRWEMLTKARQQRVYSRSQVGNRKLQIYEALL